MKISKITKKVIATSGFKDRVSYYVNVTFRQNNFFYRFYKKESQADLKIVGMIRQRNEGLLLQDSLDHLATFVDGIVVFDDASDDNSAEIARNHPAVIEVIVQKKWKKTGRIWEEAANRKKLHDRAKKYAPEWMFYCDADERFQGDIREYLLQECPDDVNVVRISLFDAYITSHDQRPYQKNAQLYNFRKYFGPERRDIAMIWRNNCGADFKRKDGREPQEISDRKEVIRFYCQHYGKSLSIGHWEETCDYYIKHFPKYSEKWSLRKGKAVHSVSDFGRKLYTWKDVKNNSVKNN